MTVAHKMGKKEKDRLLTPYEVRCLQAHGAECRTVKDAYRADFPVRLEEQFWRGNLREGENELARLIMSGWGKNGSAAGREAFFRQFWQGMAKHYMGKCQDDWWCHMVAYPGAWFAFAFFQLLRDHEEMQHYLGILRGYIDRGMTVAHPGLGEIAARKAQVA